MLQADLASKFSNTVHEIFTFAVNDFLHVLSLVLGHGFTLLNSLNFFVDSANFFLSGGEALLVVELLLLLLFNFLSKFYLLSSALFEFSLVLEELLFLLHGGLHGFISSEHFLLHFVESFEGFSSLLFLFLLNLLFLLEFLNKLGFLFFSHFGLSFDFGFLFFEFLSDLFLFSFDLFLHLLHFLLVLNVGYLMANDGTAFSHLTATFAATTTVEVDFTSRGLCKLLS